MHNPKTPHLDAINRILRYLKNNTGKGIWFKHNNSNEISSYFDADWVRNFDSKSINNFCTFIGENIIT
jgi:hypothetical protein